jgi:PKD repeat protein
MKAIVLILTCCFFSTFTFAQSYHADFLDGRIMFKVRQSPPLANSPQNNINDFSLIENIDNFPQIKEILKEADLTKIERPSYYTHKRELQKIYRIHFSNYAQIDALLKELNALDQVEYACKQAIYQTTLIPNDTYHSGSDKWYHTLVNSESAWNTSTGRSGVKVAIIDNAVYANHSDLSTFRQYDVADNDNDATPPDSYQQDMGWSHGTHCAGLATADINNNRGIASLGGNVELIGVKATPDNAPSSNGIWYAYSAVQWACQNGADVVSMSYGGTNSDPAMQTLIDAYPDIVFMAAAGNDGNSIVQYPAGYNNVIGVGSVNSNGNRSSFSNYNGSTTFVDIASPGGYSNGGLLSTVYTSGGNSYAKMGGTSMATPFAAGLVGLMLSVNPSLTPSQVLNCLSSTGVVTNQNIGNRIDAAAAIACVQATITGDPIPDFFAIPTDIAEGESVQFYDNSADGGNTINTWQWTFNGGTPASYTGQTPPLISYATAGNYPVSLQVSNAQDSVTATKTAYINVSLQPYGAWIKQNSSFSTASRGINYISIVDANTVWATGYDGTGNGGNIQEFTKTTDGGANWSANTINIGNSGLGISMIHPVDANTAWLAAYPTAGGQTGGIWKTSNGGTSWSRQNSASYNSAASFTNVVHFWDANNGFCQGDPINGEFELYTTTNGGTTWTAVPGANIPNPSNGNEFGYTRQIEVVGNSVWFTTSLGRIYHSTNKGLNWSVYTSPIADFGGAISTGSSANLSFGSLTEGIIVDNNGTVYKTSNSGATWTPVTISGTVFTNGLCYVEGTNIVFTTGAATGASGSSFSQDGGTSWNIIDTEQHLVVEFSSQSIGWSGWFNADANTDGMWKWNDLSSPLSPGFAGSPFNICTNDTVQFTDLTAGGTPTSWNWSFPGGNPSSSTLSNPQVQYNTAGIYEVSLTVSDGTFQSTLVDTAHIVVVAPSTTPSTISGPVNACAFDNLSYSVSNDPTVVYNWTFPSGWSGTSSSNSITLSLDDSAGTLSVTADNVCGSSPASSLAINITDTVVADFIYNANGGQLNFTSNATLADTWAWDFGDNNSSSLENPTHNYASDGNYTVQLIVNNTCGYSDTTTQVISVQLTNVNQIAGATSDLKIYPNPAYGSISVDGMPQNWIGNQLIEISDILGRVVLRTEVSSTLQPINVSGLNSGVYTIVLNEGRQSFKFVKK